MEIWKNIDCMGGAYSVSNQGRVRSEPRMVNGSRGTRFMRKGQILKTRRHPYGYPMVTMSVDGKHTTRTVHSLVAEAFIGPRPDGLVVCHRDGNPENCNDWNLRYGTECSNVADAISHGTKPLGDDHGGSTLTVEQVLEMRERRSSGETLSSLANAFKVAEPTVWKITTGKMRAYDPGPLTKSKTTRILTPEECEQLRARRQSGEMRKDLVAEFGISRTQFDRIMKEAA